MSMTTRIEAGRYAVAHLRVERDRLLSVCECPPHLCRHGNEMMEVVHWHVWDTRTHDYVPGGEEFATKREAESFAHRHLRLLGA
jgi:hypothetical protein